jgi:hypothetical protein
LKKSKSIAILLSWCDIMGPCYHIVDLITQFLTQHFLRLSLSFSCKKYKLLLSSLLFFCTDFLLSSLYHTSMNLACFIFPAYFSLKAKHNCFDGSKSLMSNHFSEILRPKEIFLLRSCDGPRPCAYKIDHWTKDWTHICLWYVPSMLESGLLIDFVGIVVNIARL